MRILAYTIRHKYHVLLECLKCAYQTRTPSLVWRGIRHDNDKFRPFMLKAYAERFSTGIHTGRDSTGYYDPHKDSKPDFQRAFLAHIRKNDHHWQWYVEATEQGERVHAMTEEAVLEMVCDWVGAARAQGQTPDPIAWFCANEGKMRLHNDTVNMITNELRRREVICRRTS